MEEGKSKLEEIAAREIARMLSANRYTQENNYQAGHPDAISDGDERGRGEKNGQIGTSVDIKKIKDSLSRNKYGEGNEYGG